MPFTLPDLPFDRAALEPHISAETFDYHHGKHHKAYVDKTNALAKEEGHEGKGLIELIKAAKKGPLFNNAAQLWNHSFFWPCLSPTGGKPSADLAARIERDLGGHDKFVEDFSKAADEHFGSGWAWLVEMGGKLEIVSYHDADTPVAHPGVAPLFTLDVWEHAYYIDYRNERPKFVEAVLKNCVNWDFVAQNLDGKGAGRADQA
ncbi:MAG: superoxide dismutase [Sphingomonadaceae bacterium]|nr:superoxide dismutase [Sphingomonadaceae bacterium]